MNTNETNKRVTRKEYVLDSQSSNNFSMEMVTPVKEFENSKKDELPSELGNKHSSSDFKR